MSRGAALAVQAAHPSSGTLVRGFIASTRHVRKHPLKIGTAHPHRDVQHDSS